MQLLCIAVVLGLLAGCESGPSGRWIQDGKTDLDAQQDYAQCERDAIFNSEGLRSVEPFKESMQKKSCMKQKGYKYFENK